MTNDKDNIIQFVNKAKIDDILDVKNTLESDEVNILQCQCGSINFILHESGTVQCGECNIVSNMMGGYILDGVDDE